ncbi:MAG: hypothetical protein AAGA60_26370, partial [Cyanobacteria bacterium P01_E01_bin.42]
AVIWQEAFQQLQEEWVDLIDAAADIIESKGIGFLEISSDELNKLQKQVRELVDQIKDLDLDPKLKKFLIRQLRKIEESLLDYHIRGSVGVEKVEKEVLGRIISEVVQNEKLQQARDIVGKVLKYVVEIDKVVKAGEHFAKLPHFIDKFLPPHQ